MKSEQTTYDADFYAFQRGGSAASAQRIVPYVMELLAPATVIDIGCGVGTWLLEYARRGAEVHGIDGAWVDATQLVIPRPHFTPCDLTNPPALGRRYSLAQSLEVAEHLDHSCASGFVSYLVSLSDFVVFSAAAPLQGGAHHVNEQWPGYWARLFKDHGYRLYDIFRARYWDDAEVEYWYSQNMFLFIRDGADVPASIRACEGFKMPERVVHPRRLKTRTEQVIGLLADVHHRVVRPSLRRLSVIK